MFYKASQGWSGRRLKDWLDEQGVTTRSGKSVPVSSLLAMLLNPFYYGEFQYPEGADARWYKGAHKPLVSRELWNEVQQSRGAIKGVWGSKQFAFRGLITCGQCGAMFTAQEKFKKLKSGEYNRHVYYSCTRRIDPNCQEKYINEIELSQMLLKFIEQHYDEIKITDKLRVKIERHYQITKTLMEHYRFDHKLDKPFIEYSRYVLSKGTELEKLAFSNGIDSKIEMTNGLLQSNVRSI
jgi:predicted metal-binding protein